MKKNIGLILGIIVIIGVVVASLNIESVEEHYQTQEQSNQIIGTVTLAIECATLLDESNYRMLEDSLKKEEYVPSSGIILEATEFVIREGDTVFDILNQAVREKAIQMDYQGAEQNVYGSVYIQGINHIYEFSAGPLSGWMYQVNGVIPDYGCSKYSLQDGDQIVFQYTCDLGRDLGRE